VFFAQPKVKFLGHFIGSGQVQLLLDRVEAIKMIAPPTTKKLVRSALGMFGFIRDFIPHFAGIARPLTDLTKGRSPFKFVLNIEQLKAFQDLKDSLFIERVLVPPDYLTPFNIYTDSSEHSVGHVSHIRIVRNRDLLHLLFQS